MTVYTFFVVICLRRKPHNLQIASQIHLPVQNTMRRVDSLANPKIERRNFQWMFRSFIFRRAKWGFQGGEAPLASLGCARTGCIRCKMACHFAKLALSSPPRLQGFLRGVDVGKAASGRALLSPHSPPKKSSETSKGMIVVL